MKKIAALLIALAPIPLLAQFGIRAGLNFANVTNASDINTSSRAGYNIGIFLAPGSKKILGSKTELIYSRRGYNYSSDTASGSVDLDYIALAQLMAIHITKYVEIDIGGQTAYLLNAKADSSKQIMTGNAQVNPMLSFYNRFDYGFGGGIEVHPIAGLIIGGRYEISLSNLYKNTFNYSGTGTQPPSFYPSPASINLKNNSIQLYAGYRF